MKSENKKLHHKNHSHEHDHHEHSHDGIGHHHHGSNNLTIAFWINFAFTIIEIVGGIYTNSIAVLSDAVHDLGDSVALLFALIMEKVSHKKSDEKLTFGYKRFSILGAFVNSVILIAGSVFVLYTAVNRLFSVEEINVKGMIIMAVAGIIFNGIAVLKLTKEESMNSRVVFLHLLEDVLGWVSILAVSIVMFFIDLPILDPILSIVIAVFILSRIIPNLMKVARVFLQYKPDDKEIEVLKREIEAVDRVEGVHDIHLWSLDAVNHIFSCHLIVSDTVTLNELMVLKQKVKKLLEDHGIGHATIEPEIIGEKCESCDV